jgi:hypothetical protein
MFIISERSFYNLSCFCRITQSVLNEIVSPSDQEKHSEAEIKKEDTKLSEFRCPKCSKPCDDYKFDPITVNLFRQNFTGARFTYILVDITSSMTANFLHSVKKDPKSPLSRITQTKEAIKQLLIEIAENAEPGTGTRGPDQVILTTFDEKLIKPDVIPLCNATDIAAESNLACIDAIELSHRSVKTYFYSVLKEIYETLERKPFLYIDLYLFSDGIDTSPKKNDTTYQAIIRGLNEKLGAKLHFMNCGSEAFSVAAWLGDSEADCPISGNRNEIRAQIKAAYKNDHTKNPNLPPTINRRPGDTLDKSISSSNTYMTDAEVASIRKPPLREASSSNSNPKTVDDYIVDLPSATHPRSVATSNSKSDSLGALTLLTRNPNVRKRK